MPLPLPRAAIAVVVLLSGLSWSANFAAANMAQDADVADPPSFEQLTIPDLAPPADSASSDDSALDNPDVPMAELWTCHWLPNGLIYRSYLAGVKEPRFALVQSHRRRLRHDVGRLARRPRRHRPLRHPERLSPRGLRSRPRRRRAYPGCNPKKIARPSTPATTASASRSPTASVPGNTNPATPTSARTSATSS